MEEINPKDITKSEEPQSKTYVVELTNQKRLAKWFVVWFALTIVSIAMCFYSDSVPKSFLLVPVVIFILFNVFLRFKQKEMSEIKELELFDDKLVIKGPEETEISFAEIKSYTINYYKAISIRFDLKKVFKPVSLIESRSSTSSKKMYDFTKDLDGRLQKLIASRKISANRQNLVYIWIIALLILVLSTSYIFYDDVATIIKTGHLPPIPLLIFPFVGVWFIITLAAVIRENIN